MRRTLYNPQVVGNRISMSALSDTGSHRREAASAVPRRWLPPGVMLLDPFFLEVFFGTRMQGNAHADQAFFHFDILELVVSLFQLLQIRIDRT